MNIKEAEKVLERFKKGDFYIIPIDAASKNQCISEAILSLCTDDIWQNPMLNGDYVLSGETINNENYYVLHNPGKAVDYDYFNSNLQEIKLMGNKCGEKLFEVNEDTGEIFPWLNLDNYYNNSNCQIGLDKLLCMSGNRASKSGYVLACTFSKEKIIYYYFKISI